MCIDHRPETSDHCTCTPHAVPERRYGFRQRCSSNECSSNTPVSQQPRLARTEDKSLVLTNLRRLLRFELLKTVLVAVRGHCIVDATIRKRQAIPDDELDLNLVHTTNDEDEDDEKVII